MEGPVRGVASPGKWDVGDAVPYIPLDRTPVPWKKFPSNKSPTFLCLVKEKLPKETIAGEDFRGASALRAPSCTLPHFPGLSVGRPRPAGLRRPRPRSRRDEPPLR